MTLAGANLRVYRRSRGIFKRVFVNLKFVSFTDLQDHIICESEDIGLNKDTKVSFKVYNVSKGLGAMGVTNEDGTPIEFEKEVSDQA